MPIRHRRGRYRRAPQPISHLINHVVLVLDCSLSMKSRKNDVIKVADSEIKYLANRSKELQQETRVSVYVFDEDVDCLVYDTDVLRLPSIESLYETGGNTALIDATLTAIDELEKTATLHGDHSFLIYVLTDGQENRSNHGSHELRYKINMLGENWTLACFVPDPIAKRDALNFGFTKDNVAIWDTTSSRGIEDVGDTVRKATESWMQARSTGVRGTRTLFSTGSDAVNKQTVAAAGLVPLDFDQYEMLPVQADVPSEAFMYQQGYQYVKGTVHYLLTKTEEIQPQKAVMIVDKKTNRVFAGDQARDIVGLPPGMTVKVKPNYNPDYEIYVQSTAPNRKLLGGTRCILHKPIKRY